VSVLALARSELLALRPYSSARMEAGRAAVMLNANESPYAPFPVDAHGLNRYPEPQPAELLGRLAAAWGVRPPQVFLGRGSDEAIDLLVRAFCRAGEDSLLVCPPTFGMYRVAAGVQGARVVEVPLRVDAGFALDVDALLQAEFEHPCKLVFVCAPNNPTGGDLPLSTIRDLAGALQERALLVVDEAYVEYAGRESAASLLDAHPNLAVLRTLSKAWGLAGARIGALLAAPEVVGLLRRIMAPYPLPTPCVAAALAACEPAATAERSARVARTLAERARVAAALAAHPAVRELWPSAANFLAFRVDDGRATWLRLGERGVVVRDVGHYPGLQQCLRVSIGTPAENDAFLAAL